MADLFSILQMLGLGGQQQPAPQGQQIGNLAGAGFPGAQAMQQQNPVANAPTPPQGTGLMGMLGGAQADPMMLAAQLGGMTPGTPQYAQTQQAMQAASAAQQKRAMSMGLLQTGLSTAAARDPLGYPAGAIQGLAQGVPAGMQADDAMLNRARQTSQSLLGAQQTGQQMAMNSYDLQTKQRLMQQYGLSDPQALMMVMATKSSAGMMKTLQDLMNDPKTPPDVKSRAQSLLAGGASGLMGMTPDKLTQSLYGQNANPSVQALNTAKANELNTRSGLEGFKAESGRIAAEGGTTTNPLSPKTVTAKAAASRAETAAATLHDKEAADYIKFGEGAAIVSALGTDIDPHELSLVMADPSKAPPLAKFKDGETKIQRDPDTGATMWWTRKGAQMVPLTGPPASTGVTPGLAP